MPSPPKTLAETAAKSVISLPPGRNLIALAGPPGAGKSTVADHLRQILKDKGRKVAVVPMDGFHLDNRLLDKRGLRARKGAPDTFDVAGFRTLVQRIKNVEQQIIYPTFDRSKDTAIAGAIALANDVEDVIFEGNYLLLNHPDWTTLQDHWSMTLLVSAQRDTLKNRLMARWRREGLPENICRKKVEDNDMPNVDLVLSQSAPADIDLTG